MKSLHVSSAELLKNNGTKGLNMIILIVLLALAAAADASTCGKSPQSHEFKKLTDLSRVLNKTIKPANKEPKIELSKP